MQLDELPHWMLKDDIDFEVDGVGGYGRGHRERPEVTYDDGLSDNAWTKMIEEGTDEAPKKKRGRPSLRDKEMRERDDDSRKRKAEGAPGRGRGRGDKRQKRAPPTDAQVRMHQKFLDLWNKMKSSTDSTSRNICQIFMRLPAKKMYPDYYELIKNPIDMKKIKDKIEAFDYTDVDQYSADFNLMYNNAQEYNQEGSQIFNDAVTLQKKIKDEIVILTENINKPSPNEVNGESDSESNTSRSSSTGSSKKRKKRIVDDDSDE